MGGNSQVLAGESGQPAARRGLFRFDLSSIPSGSLINSATLSLTVQGTGSGFVSSNFELHRSLKSWSEGSGTGNNGAAANVGETTWNARFYDPTTPTLWSVSGGLAGTDFATAVSGSTLLNNTGAFNWTGTSVASDVQTWVNSPGSNFGWFLISDNEATASTAVKIGSRETTLVTERPTLNVSFTPVPEPGSVALALAGILGLGAFHFRRFVHCRHGR